MGGGGSFRKKGGEEKLDRHDYIGFWGVHDDHDDGGGGGGGRGF